MRLDEEEPYDAWVERALAHEKEIAGRRIAKGDNIDTVLEDLSRNLMKKLLHPLLDNIRKSAIIPFDAEKSRQDYNRAFQKNNNTRNN
jgi:glutamyl-tRNA reductase